MSPLFIAEVKTQSPFGFSSSRTWDELFSIAEKYGDWISVHTDTRWGGSFELLKKARKLTKKPILAKGIHATDGEIEAAFAAGADYVLVVGRVPMGFDPEKLLIEPLTKQQFMTFNAMNLPKLVWNKRDLKDGSAKKESFDDIASMKKNWLCQASGIKTIADVHPKADAFIVGEHLEEFVKTL